MLLLTTFICLVVAVVGTPPHGRIVGGGDASIRDYPHQLSLHTGGTYECGAIIISPLWVLTAAQCAGGLISNMHLHGGSASRYTGGQNFTVAQKVVHLNYDAATSDFDIALLRVSEPFMFGTNYKNVALPDEDAPDPTGLLEVSGWGNTLPGGVGTDALQVVDVDFVPADTCAQDYAPTLVSERMVCAASEGKDACQGDSGGPLIVQGTDPAELVGIVSWGRGCALAGFPGVYTKVASFRSWILANSGV